MEQRLSRAIPREFAAIFFLVILWLVPGTSETRKSHPGCQLKMKSTAFDLNDKEYGTLMTFFFAVDEINRNPDILPNVTLGYHVFDSCGDSQKSVKNVLGILSGRRREAPNYSCQKKSKIAGFLGDRYSATSIAAAQVLGLYGYTQISYGATDPLLSDRILYPYFFRTTQNDLTYYEAIVKLLKYFDWNWVGIMTTRDQSGETQLRELSQVITGRGICIEFIIKISDTLQENHKDLDIIKKSTSQVIIAIGTCHLNCVYAFLNNKSAQMLQNITLIYTSSWSYVLTFSIKTGIPFSSGLSFSALVTEILGLQTFMETVQLSNDVTDPLQEDIWLLEFHCLTSNRHKSDFFQCLYNFTANNCTGKQNIIDLISYKTDSIPYLTYTAVNALARALHNMNRRFNRPEKDLLNYEYQNKVNILLSYMLHVMVLEEL
ncbi:vomeronasal type-2 receptor 26-like [Spea bombifrons]|uniref:vomeronasal type-2 receptor 26-like n=1 Tax=Spea bombifrons TaxID=233779 RepID=UPI002349A6F8|nr:vomeronasal type-2 receptor 26-like [Spea bombifrons]